MPPFKSSRIDPYKNFKFRVKFESSTSYVAGVSKVSALKRTTEVVKFRDGGDESTSRKSPGRTEYDAITLERGVTHDTDFEQWANKVWDYNNAQASNATQEVSLSDFRKNITIDLFNEAGPEGHLLPGFPVLGVGVPAHARAGRQCQRCRHPAHQAGERGLDP